MSMTDPIADFLTRIRNAGRANHQKVNIRFSKEKEAISKILQKEGYIKGYEVIGDKNKEIVVTLKYFKKKPVIQELKRVSKPGRRVYINKGDIRPIYNNLGVGIVSTSKGIITANKAKELGIGGEVVCHVF